MTGVLCVNIVLTYPYYDGSLNLLTLPASYLEDIFLIPWFITSLKDLLWLCNHVFFSIPFNRPTFIAFLDVCVLTIFMNMKLYLFKL